MSEWNWGIKKVLVVGLMWVIGVVGTVTSIGYFGSKANSDADHHRERIVKECLDSGQSWISGNCIRGSVVKP